MILNVDVRSKEFVVTKLPEPKVDGAGVQRAEKETHQPLWSTEVCVTDVSGGEIIRITTSGKSPDVEVGEPVLVTHLVAHPWYSNGRGGVSYRADSIVPETRVD